MLFKKWSTGVGSAVEDVDPFFFLNRMDRPVSDPIMRRGRAAEETGWGESDGNFVTWSNQFLFHVLW